MDELIRVGVDLGKSYFQVHALTGPLRSIAS
jgi:hypothetical protein